METQRILYYSSENKIYSILIYRMVRKINVVDLNEIKSENNHLATHTENIEPVVEEVEEPVETLPDVSIQSIEKPVVMKKGDEKTTCPFCNKLMTVKALRYSHDKNCKGKPQPAPKEDKPAAASRAETYVKVEEPPTPRHSVPEPIHKTKLTRTELKQQRINNLVSQAF